MKTLIGLLLLSLCITTHAGNYNRLPDGTYVQINERVVYEESWLNYNYDCDFFWCAGANRISSIPKVISGNYAYEGDLVTLDGYMVTIPDGSRAIELGQVGYTVDQGYPLPRSLGMNLNTLAFAPLDSRVRVWGTVTDVDSDAWPVANSYILDNKIRVYDAYNATQHIVGNFEQATGALTQELDSTGTIMLSTIQQAYTGCDTNEPRSGPMYSVAGGIYLDTAAAGKIATINTDSGSTTCALDSTGTGFYQLALPTGNYAISAEIPGYSTMTMAGTVDQDYYDADFYWANPIPVDYIVAAPERVNIGTAIFTGWKYDAEARSMPKSPVPWLTDTGQSGTAITDSQGNFAITLQSSISQVVTLDIDDSEIGYVQFANPTEPTLLITSPVNGDIEHDWMDVEIDFEDMVLAGNGATVSKQIFVDGQPYSIFNTDCDATINTVPLANGLHSLQAVQVNSES